MPTKAELEAQLTAAQKELEQIKQRVLEQAKEAKEEHNWCAGGVNAALEYISPDLSLSKTGTVEVTMTFQVSLSDDSGEDFEPGIKDTLNDHSWRSTEVLREILEDSEYADVEVSHLTKSTKVVLVDG